MKSRAHPEMIYLLNVESDGYGGIISDFSLMVPRYIRGDLVFCEQQLSHETVNRLASRARQIRVSKLFELEQKICGSSFLLGTMERDLRLVEFEQTRRSIAKWDYEHIISPIESIMLMQSGILVFRRTEDMPRLNISAAIREGIFFGRLPSSMLQDWICLPTWVETVDDLMVQLSTLGLYGLPLIQADKSVIVLGADAPNEFLSAIAIGVDDEDKRDALEDRPEELRSIAWLGLLRDMLIEEASALGMNIYGEATAQDLMGALGKGADDMALFVIAHQDKEGVHIGDTIVSMQEIEQHISLYAPEKAYGAVDLAICGADSPGNLANIFTRYGSLIVLTRGAIGYQGRAMARLLGIVRMLRAGYVGSLSALHSWIWASEMGLWKGLCPR